MSQIDAPQLGSVHFVAGQIGWRSLAVFTGVALIIREPFNEKLEFSVTIYITDGDFIRTIAAGQRP